MFAHPLFLCVILNKKNQIIYLSTRKYMLHTSICC